MVENLQENDFQNNSQDTFYSKHSIVLYVVLFVIIAGVVFFLYKFPTSLNLLDSSPEKKIFSEEEKFEILNSLSEGNENTLSIEERKKILNEITENRTNDLYDYSEEGKLQILRSLQ